MMGRMMIMMGQMMQMMGEMQMMMAGDSMGMDYGSMPMMKDAAIGEGSCLDGRSCQGMEGMSGSAPLTGTLPLTATAASSSAAPGGAATGTGLAAVTAEAGGVTVAVTPLTLGDPHAASLDFQVALDTHTVELGDDLAKLAVLKVGGRDVPATSWQAPEGGHHVSGLLTFPAVDAAGNRTLDNASTVTLIIRNLAGVPLRTFTWTLSGS